MSLKVFVGCMMSSKTTMLLQEITRYADASNGKIRPLVINHTLDNRNIDTKISSHSSMFKGLSDKVDFTFASKLSDVDVSKYTVVALDETQFFPDLYDTVVTWLKQGKHIVCAGLDGTYQMKLFGMTYSLLPIADEFVKLKAICSVCMQENSNKLNNLNTYPAAFTDKFAGDPTKEVEIGAGNMYRACCRRHHSSWNK